ncbi:microtubule-associated protein futsch isoform X1 [Esox lucius]|uniref:microtubule-associated protein futsch isoform X1 n=1 Tax=Esox lucius TaxID=8010 RepID=UPI0014775B5A|nr:microtubule-associated protein futsch isoform X1 [Esox lucius]
MAGLPPGDPQLVSMIVNHLKTQGLFDQFRRDCLADVDTKPAYLNLRQRVDNFVSNHLSNHTWSPHLNKNQLRNNIRQLVLQRSGMLEQGVDRIVAQVVDPKIHHTFRPQVERVVREFLSPGSYVEEHPVLSAPVEDKQELNLLVQANPSAPATSMAGDAMSILDTITNLNQEASSRASSNGEKGRKGGSEKDQFSDSMQEAEAGQQETGLLEEGEEDQKRKTPEQEEEAKLVSEVQAIEVKTEDVQEQYSEREGMTEDEEEEFRNQEQTEESKEVKSTGLLKDEVQNKDLDPLQSPNEKHHIKQKARERLKEEYSLEDSDLDGLSDITVSSVHTSDLSSFEEDSDDEQPLSDSTEDGEVSSENDKSEEKKTNAEDDNEGCAERKPRRQAYVHKPFLYSRYYSDSDDEVTVEQRRRSAAKDKEERLLKRQQNRERMEEKRRQKAAQVEDQETRLQTPSPSLEAQDPRAKAARKEKKVLEKKMAVSRKRKRDLRKEGYVIVKRKEDTSGDINKKEEGKSTSCKSFHHKSVRKVSESVAAEDGYRRKSGSISEDAGEPRKLTDKSRTHSFILDLEQGSESPLRQRLAGKFDRLSRKELNPKERKEKERSLSDERAKFKQKRVGGEYHTEQKEGVLIKISSDDKGERKFKVKGDRKVSMNVREGRASVSEGGASDEGAGREITTKKGKLPSAEAAKFEKDKMKEKEKDKMKDKDREKGKGEKITVKSGPKPLLCPDSTGSSEERSDMEPGYEIIKKKEKHPKDILKRSKNHNEDMRGEKTKPKPDSEKEKPSVEHVTQENQKPSKSVSETEKKSRETEPGLKAMEKSRSKLREDLKVQSSSKMDRKALALENKNKGGCRPEMAKERNREGSLKEQKKDPEEKQLEKMEGRTGKKMVDKKIKSLVQKESQDERNGHKVDEKLIKSSSVSSPAITDLPLKINHQSKDTSTDSDRTAATFATSISDDTYDALSDITPEPEDDDDVVMRLQEVEPGPLTSGADALLTLMDICTSADARLCEGSGITSAMQEDTCPELSFQEADIKMKEAALTLLSMDPESIISPSLVTLEVKEVSTPALQLETTLFMKEQEDAEDVMEIDKSDVTTTSLYSEKMHEWSQDVSYTGVKITDVTTETLVGGILQDSKATIDRDEKLGLVVLEQEPVLGSSVNKPAPSEAASETELDNVKSETIEDSDAVPIQYVADTSSQAGKDDKDQTDTQQRKGAPGSAKSDSAEPPKETRRGRQIKLVKQASIASKSDGQEDENGSDLPEVDNGQKASEPRPLRRGRSSKTSTDGEELTEPEKVEETPPRRGRWPGAFSKDTNSGNNKKNADEKAREISEEKRQILQKEDEERIVQKRGGCRGKPTKPLVSNDEAKEVMETSDSKITDARKPAVKRKRSDETEQSEQVSQSREQEENLPIEQQEEEDTKPVEPEEVDTQPEEQEETQAVEQEEEESQAVEQEEETQAVEQEEEETQAMALEETPAVALEETPAVALEETPAVALEETPAVALEETPAVALEETPAVALEETPAVALEETPAVALEETPAVALEETPAVALEETPAVALEETPAVALEETPAVAPELEETPAAAPEEEGETPAAAPEEEGETPAAAPEEEGQTPAAAPEEEGEMAQEPQPGQKDSQKFDIRGQEEKQLPEDNVSQSEDVADGTEQSSNEGKINNDDEDKDTPQKKPARRGRPSKGTASSSEEPEETVSEKPDEKDDKQKDAEEEDEDIPKTRTATRAVARLEAERNKPSKPSTRARGKEENIANTRGTRGQASASAKAGGRKREASPPAVRTRGGQKLEEPTTKRTKR